MTTLALVILIGEFLAVQIGAIGNVLLHQEIILADGYPIQSGLGGKDVGYLLGKGRIAGNLLLNRSPVAALLLN